MTILISFYVPTQNKKYIYIYIYNHNTLHFRSFLAKTSDSILGKCPKSLFLPIFPDKSGSVTFDNLWTPNITSCKISEKTNESIPRKVRY